MSQDLGPILDTLREVHVSLERRAERAAAATGVTWGLVASSIFAFYAWTHANEDDALVRGLTDAGLIDWMWIPPTLVGYALTLAVGARLGRMAPRSEQARWNRWLLVALLVPVAAVVVLNVADVGHGIIPSMWVVFLGIVNVRWGAPKQGVVGKVATFGSFAVAAALAFLPVAWANLGASVWYLVALAGLCAWSYHRN